LYGLEAGAVSARQGPPDARQVLLSLAGAGIGLTLAVAVFFLFPYFQGGILGQVRDRLESPEDAPGLYGSYARANYARLLGSQALFALLMVVVIAPVICLGAGIAIQDQLSNLAAQTADGTSSAVTPNPQQIQRQLLSHPAMLAGMALGSILVSAAGMVYWVANCVMVTGQESVFAAWRKSLVFCRENFFAVLVVWLLNLLAGVVMAPLLLVGQLGFVTDIWILCLLGLAYSVLIGYWAVVLAGLSMSLYLHRRVGAGQLAPTPALGPAGD